jgi:hypothetical protein
MIRRPVMSKRFVCVLRSVPHESLPAGKSQGFRSATNSCLVAQVREARLLLLQLNPKLRLSGMISILSSRASHPKAKLVSSFDPLSLFFWLGQRLRPAARKRVPNLSCSFTYLAVDAHRSSLSSFSGRMTMLPFSTNVNRRTGFGEIRNSYAGARPRKQG